MTSIAAQPAVVRARGALRAIRDLNRDPNRLDLVFVLGEAVNRTAFPRVKALFERDPDGRRVLTDRPELDSRRVDLDALARLPDGTLGREYVRFLRDNGITPDVFKAPEGVDPDAAFLAMRVRQTHDLWHVITGYAPDVRGEVLLQAFTFAQLRVPSSGIIALFGLVRGSLRLGPSFAKDMARAVRRGRRARAFAPMYWEEHWAEPVSALRERLACPAAGVVRH
jgi:ubiquinone biosynthesis protein COQ4